MEAASGPSWQPSAEEISRLFGPLCGFDAVILAVSGGSDSMALLHLAALWKAAGGPVPVLHVATVDHGLRAGSRDEAMRTGEAARRLGFQHHILEWTGAKPARGVQEQARAARYDLLIDLARRLGVGRAGIATAHTMDDQAETVLMRLARGSGPDGLRGMRAERALEADGRVRLVRPLLPVMRAELRSFLTARGAAWIEDPSNEDLRFERVRLRQEAAALQRLGLTPQMLSLAARRQERAAAALEAMTDALQGQCLDVHHGAFASLDGLHFAAAAEELRVRLMTRVLAAFGGTSPRAELQQVERLVCDLERRGGFRTTLGGCQVRACAREIRVFREPGRAQIGEAVVAPGQSLMFDGRFLITLSASAASSARVRALDPVSFRALVKAGRGRIRVPARAAATLPAVWLGENLAAVGGLQIGSEPGHVSSSKMAVVRAEFTPIGG